MDVGKDSGKKPNGVNFLARILTEGVPLAGSRASANAAGHRRGLNGVRAPKSNLASHEAGMVQDGNLDFQFNPGGSSAKAATASVTNFRTVGGIPASTATLTGDAAGMLPDPLTLSNGTAFNDIFQGFTFGSTSR
jgi:hypothetical protein